MELTPILGRRCEHLKLVNQTVFFFCVFVFDAGKSRVDRFPILCESTSSRNSVEPWGNTACGLRFGYDRCWRRTPSSVNLDLHPRKITTTVSADGLVYTNGSRRLLWAHSSEGWASGRCTFAMRFLGRHPDIMPGFHGPPTLHPDGSTESLGDHVAVLTWPACTLQTSAGKIWSADSDPYVSGTTVWLQLDVDRGEVLL